MAAADVAINILTEFTGKKAFKQADTEVVKLTKGVKKLAGAFGIAFGTTAILAYGKASLKAAAADLKAQQQLALALKNVGLERDAAASEAFIQRLQTEFGVVDDLLRPAFQTLAIATRDAAQSQKLLGLALDISAATGKDLNSVTSALSKAYLGSNTALSKLGVGISKADLKMKSFDQVTNDLANTFKGAATAASNTFAGSMAKLEVASANVKEIIGVGIIDSLKILSGNTSVADLAADMEKAATNSAKLLVNMSKFVNTVLGPIKEIAAAMEALVLDTDKFVDLIVEGDPSGFFKKAATGSFTTPMTISGQVQLATQTKITKQVAKQAADTKKILADKRLTLAIDKANLALGKGESVFDIDAIQNNAALINQAEQLGKVTNAAQVLAIANDVARLNVKKSMLDLEAAIASGDVKAIENATAKLNADLKILGALTGQTVKMQDIKSILESLKSRDLINLDNLDAAIAKMLELLKLQGQAATTTTKPTPATSTPILGKAAIEAMTPAQAEALLATMPSSVSTTLSPAVISGNRYAAQAADAFAKAVDKVDLTSEAAQSSFMNGIAGGLNIPAAVSGSRYAAQGIAAAGGAGVVNNITINAGIGTDTEAVARAIEDVLRRANQRGTSTDLIPA